MDKQSVLEVLVRCVVKGQSAGVYSIKDSSGLYDIILHLRGVKKSDTIKEDVGFTSLVRAVVAAHGRGVYTLEESSVIDKTISWLADEKIIVLEDKLPTIKEEDEGDEEDDGVKEV